MSNSGTSTPERNDSFKSMQENFDLNAQFDPDTQESEKSQQNNITKISANENEDTDLQLDKDELERIFSEPFEEVTVSTETNEKLAQLANENRKKCFLVMQENSVKEHASKLSP